MAPFFKLAEIAADACADHATIIRQMRAGACDGILVRGVYTPADCATLCERLEAEQHGLPRTDFPPVMRAFFLGMNLNLTHPDLRAYFAAVPGFAQGLTRLSAGMDDLQPRLTGLFSALDGGRRYQPAPGPQPGLSHMFTTIRAHRPGGFIPPHFDSEQALRASYRFINQAISGDIFSFVLGLSIAETGGALEIFNIKHDGQAWQMSDHGRNAADIPLQGVDHISLRLAPGDLVLFNSGRFLHRVVPVGGTRTRWTVCSFMAEARDGQSVHCWG